MKKFYSIAWIILLFGGAPAISVKEKDPAPVVDVKKQPEEKPFKIYLTFDDGPLYGSKNVADAITRENIPITVFVVGQHIANSSSQRQIFNDFVSNPMIEIGNHSFSHAHNKFRKFYAKPSSVYSDFQKCYQDYNLPTKLCRLPGRNIWRTAGFRRDDMLSGSAAADTLYNNGYAVIGWDLEWRHDAGTSSPAQSVQEIAIQIENRLKNDATRTKGHLILLSHDEMFSKSWEESELKQLVDTLKATNLYEFEFVSKYPNVFKP